MLDLSEIFKDSRLVALVTDAQGRVIATTPGAEKVQGATLPDLMGISLPPESEDRGLLRSFRQVRSTESPTHVVVLLRGDAGQVLTLHVEDFALRQASGEHSGWRVAGELGRSQAEAECTQSILSALIDSVHGAFWAFDVTGQVATWSRSCEGYFGIPRAEAEGRLLTSRLFADAEALHRALQEAETQGRFTGELELLDREGARRPNQVTLNRLTNASGSVLGYACVALDITDRKKLEEYRRVLFDESRSGLLLAEADSLRILSANAQASRILRPPADPAGASLTAVLPSFDPADARRETLGEASGHDGIYERHWTLGGVEVECRTRVIRMGTNDYFLAEVRDITDRVRAAAQLARASAFLEKLRDEAPDALFLLDAEGRFVYTNPGGARLTGRDRDEMLGQSFEALSPTERAGLHREIFRKVLEGEQARFRTEILRADRSAVPVEISASPVSSGDDRFLLGIARDVSGQVRAEEEARAAYGALEARASEQASDLERARSAFQEEAAEREKTEQSLRAILERASRQEAALLELSRDASFLRPDSSEGARRLLAAAASVLDSDRALLWIPEGGGEALVAAAEYERRNERHSSGRRIRASGFEAWFKALREGGPLAIADAAKDERSREFWREHLSSYGLISTLVQPVRRGAGVAGYLQVDASAGRAWEPDERAFAAALAGIAGLLLSHLERDDAQRRLAARLAATQILSESADLKAAAPRLLRALAEALGWDAAALWTVDPADDLLRCRHFFASAPGETANLSAATLEAALDAGADLPGRARASGAPLGVADLSQDPGSPRAALAARDGIRAAAAAPVSSGAQVLGVLEIFRRDARDPDPALLEALGLIGRQAGQFLQWSAAEADRVRRLDETRKAYEELKKAQAQLIRSEKLASISMLLSGFAREMNDPLGDLAGSLEKMEQAAEGAKNPKEFREQSRELKGSIRDASQAARRARGMLEDFGDLARDPRSAGPADLAACLEEAVGLIPSRLLRDVKIVRTIKPLPPVRCIPEQMVQVFQHLLQNAVESIEKKGRVDVTASAAAGLVKVEIADSGAGMTDEVQARLFDPFFTTKQGHAGMGLAVSAMIVQNHGGRITVESRPKKGSTFTVELPAQPPSVP